MATKNDNTSIVSRPRRKADSSVKGRLNRWEGTDYVEFIPTGTRESNRKMIKQLGNSSFYQSLGEKESSYSLHMNIDGKSEDPVGELFEQFLHLTEGERKHVPQMPSGSEGRMLLDDGRTQLWLDPQQGEVIIQTRLACSPDIERQLLQTEAVMNVTIGRYRKEIVNLSNNK